MNDNKNILKKPPITTSGWCYTEVEDDIVYDYAWTIEKFCKQFTNYRPGKTMYSDQFTVMVHGRPTRWRLKMYPNGRKAVDQGYLTLFLKDSCRDQPANVRATVKFSVIDQFGSKTNTKSIDKEYKVLNHAFGYSKFIKHATLLNTERMLMPQDRLTLHCEITFAGKGAFTSGTYRPINSPVFQTERLNTMNSGYKLGGDLGRLLEDKILTDVRLVCQGREFPCHMAVLAARSAVFQAMFIHDTAEAREAKVDIEDLDPEVVSVMLEYIYTGIPVDIPPNLEPSLLAAADKYDLPELKSVCESALCDGLNIDTVLGLLTVGDRHNANVLKKYALRFIVENSSEIVQQENWRKMLQPYPALLTEMFEAIATSPPAKRRKLE